MSGSDEHDIGTPSQGFCGAHCGADPEAARHVVGGRDDPAALRVAPDDERLGAQSRLLQLLDCGEKGIQVEMSEYRHAVNATVPR